MNIQNISKSTIIRTVLMVIVIVNIILEKCGLDIIPVDENVIGMIVEILIEIAIIGVGFWKNNSFSPNAIEADKFLKRLRDGGTSEVEEVAEIESEVE